MKIGLVAEGGASRAYYSVGVMDSLMENKITADYFIGVSAGIANGVSYVSNQKGRNLEIGVKYNSKKEYMGLKHLLKTGNYYNIDYVFNEVPAKLVPFDFDAYHAFKGDVYGGVTNLETGKSEYLRLNSCEGDWSGIVASCALPVLFKPVKIGDKLYMDGGISTSIPFQKALDDGCDKLVVLLTRDRGYVKTSDFMTKFAAAKFRKKYPEFAKTLLNRADNYNKSRKNLFELETQGKAFIICPDDTSTWKRLNNSPKYIQYIYNVGYNQGQELMPKLKNFLNILDI